MHIYAGRIYQLAKEHLAALARLLAICPEPDLRLFLIDNLLEEEGISISNHGLRQNIDKQHPRIALRFVDACGISSDTLGNSLYRSPSNRFDEMINNRRWEAAIAYLTIGIEANVPRYFAPVYKALRDSYEFGCEELAFFSGHIHADERHGENGIQLIMQAMERGIAHERDIRQGVKNGEAAWWHFHVNCDRAIAALSGTA